MNSFFRATVSTLVRLTLITAGVVMAGLVLVLALVLGAGVMLWSLLTGRKPVMRFRMDPRATMAGMRARAHSHAPTRQPARPVEVIDLEAREIKE